MRPPVDCDYCQHYPDGERPYTVATCPMCGRVYDPQPERTARTKAAEARLARSLREARG